MAYRKLRIVLSKGWTLLVCSFSVAVLALTGSCRSKKVSKAPEPIDDPKAPDEVVDEYTNSVLLAKELLLSIHRKHHIRSQMAL